MNNIAFIDRQNLHLWTKSEWWSIDFNKFRIYLSDKYKIKKAYYFLGYVQDENNRLYTKLQEAWFVVVFKKQQLLMETSKKGNIDSDLIFHIMSKLLDEPKTFKKILLVSWDGDFKILVDYLIKKQRFLKILFPNKKYASSLYNDLMNKKFDYLKNIKHYISH
jgi:uncharacterized LabA/DUF88 family protein